MSEFQQARDDINEKLRAVEEDPDIPDWQKELTREITADVVNVLDRFVGEGVDSETGSA